MGISLGFSKKAICGENSHMCYSTCASLLENIGLSTNKLSKEYYVQFSAKKVVFALENYVAFEHRYFGRTTRKNDFETMNKELIYAKQILDQYREFIVDNGCKPTRFGGA